MVMQASSSFELAFLKQMLRGFRQAAVCSSKSLSLEGRKDAIKLSADVAMAAARGGGARWSRGLIANLAADEQRRPLLRSILGNDRHERLLMMVISSKSRSVQTSSWKKIPRSKSIIRRSFRVRSSRRKMKTTSSSAAIRSNRSSSSSSSSSSILARNLVRKRTQVLKKLVPGGEAMDGVSLLDETLDYVISLRAQVDLMRRLLKASSETSSSSSKLISDGRCTMQVRKASTIGNL